MSEAINQCFFRYKPYFLHFFVIIGPELVHEVKRQRFVYVICILYPGHSRGDSERDIAAAKTLHQPFCFIISKQHAVAVYYSAKQGIRMNKLFCYVVYTFLIPNVQRTTGL